MISKKIGSITAAAAATVSLLLAGAMTPQPLALAETAQNGNVTTVTLNPWYAHDSFDGWGTSLAWLANATGNYGEQGSIAVSSGDAAADAKALEYGKQLRDDFYKAIFDENGLDLNMVRYNIGGGNASDVAYGFPFMRQGAAVPGYWADDSDGSKGLYGTNKSGAAITSKQSDKQALSQAFDPTNEKHYDWSKGSSQEWWLKHGLETRDVDSVEAFTNSAPWFMTESGYAMGGTNSSANNLNDTEKFAQYLVAVTNHLEKTYNFKVDTIEGMNESETNYWGVPSGRATVDLSLPDKSGMTNEILNYYWEKHYKDKSKSVTPYTKEIKKPQEGMHIDNKHQQALIRALHNALRAAGNTHTKIAATDATDSGDLVKSYNQYSRDVKDTLNQLNTHSYGTNNQRVVRDIAQGSAKKLSMSEVDGSWQSGGFDPYNEGFSNGLGMAGKINSDVYALQSKDFTFWQVVEDLYNMSTSSTDINGHAAKIKGENTNWGTVLIDFDCTVAGKDGKLYSERAWLNNGKSTDSIAPCSVLVNSKYNAVRAYTKFIHRGDKVIANSATADNFTAASANGKTQTVIHRNTTDEAQTFVVDLSHYATISSNASGKAYVTTAPHAKASKLEATPAYLNQFSNVEQPKDAVKINAQSRTATVTVPAKSITSIELTGISGVADKAVAVDNGGVYQIIGKQSGLAVTRTTGSDSALALAKPAADSSTAGGQTWKITQVDMSHTDRPSIRAYTLSSADGKILVQRDGSTALVDSTSAEAQSDAARWILNTEDGLTWQLINADINDHARQALDVDGAKTAVGTKVGLWLSSAADNQTFSFRSVNPTGVKPVTIQTAVGVVPTSLPETVVPKYEWGNGTPAPVQWNTATIAQDVAAEGTYTISGVATNEFGVHFKAQVKLYVGNFTVTDPVSVTVLAGTSLSEVQAEIAKQPVYAHVGASEAIEVAQDKVEWDFLNVTSKLGRGAAGDVIKVPGTLRAGGTEIPVQLRIYLTSAVPVNVADTQSNLTVNVQQQQYDKGQNWTKLTDGDTSSEAWVTWGEAAPKAQRPEALIDFGDQTREIFSANITYLDNLPESVYAEYTEDGAKWVRFGKEVHSPSGKVTFKPTDSVSVQAKRIRIVNSVPSGFMNASEIEVYATPIISTPRNIASTAGTHFAVNVQEGSSGSRAIDGNVTAKGWSTWGESTSSNPTATFTFDQPQSISEVKTFFYRDGRASWPKSQTLEYQNEAGEWKTVDTKSGWYVQPSSGAEDLSTDSNTPVVDFQLKTPVVAKAIRLTNTLQDTGVYINVAEIQVFSNGGQAKPRSAQDATLGDLRVGGKQIQGFNPSTTQYQISVPQGASVPVVQAFAADTAATVTLNQTMSRDRSTVTTTITVTSADGSKSMTYTLTAKTAKMTLNKSYVHRRGYVKVTLINLMPRQIYIVWLHSTPVQLRDVQTDSEGNAAVTVTIPAHTPVGNHNVVITAQGSDDELARAPLTVVADEKTDGANQNSNADGTLTPSSPTDVPETGKPGNGGPSAQSNVSGQSVGNTTAEQTNSPDSDLNVHAAQDGRTTAIGRLAQSGTSVWGMALLTLVSIAMAVVLSNTKSGSVP